MKNLSVPFRVKALSELRDPALSRAPLQYSVMLIDEVSKRNTWERIHLFEHVVFSDGYPTMS